MSERRRICVFTHRDPEVAAEVVGLVAAAARRCGVELIAPEEEARKHPVLRAAADRAAERGWPDAAREADAAVVLAGDGTLLSVLGMLPDGPPVLGVNFGILGYLSGIGSDRIDEAVERLANGAFHSVELPMLEATTDDGVRLGAVNDIVASGGVTGRIIEVTWRIVSRGADGRERVDPMGVVPCDGMVLATAVGSTAYNLSNGGPVMAWGVDGFVVSFVAPHTLAARPLVVAPGDEVEIEHMGRGATLKVFVDGHQHGVIEAGGRLRVGLSARSARLALIDGKSFYARYRDSFAAQIQSFDESRSRHGGDGGLDGGGDR